MACQRFVTRNFALIVSKTVIIFHWKKPRSKTGAVRFVPFPKKNSCYCQTCNNRDLYVKLFELFIRLGGDIRKIHELSPIDQIILQFQKRFVPSKSEPDNPPSQVNILSIKNNFYNDLGWLTSPNLFQENVQELNNLLFERRHLMLRLKLAELVLQRENLKLDQLKLLLG